MAEKVMVVCDVCGEPAVETVTLRVRRRSLQKDLCETHLSEFTAGARPAKRGRPRTKSVAKTVQTAKRNRSPRRRRAQKAEAAASR